MARAYGRRARVGQISTRESGYKIRRRGMGCLPGPMDGCIRGSM